MYILRIPDAQFQKLGFISSWRDDNFGRYLIKKWIEARQFKLGVVKKRVEGGGHPGEVVLHKDHVAVQVGLLPPHHVHGQAWVS